MKGLKLGALILSFGILVSSSSAMAFSLMNTPQLQVAQESTASKSDFLKLDPSMFPRSKNPSNDANLDAFLEDGFKRIDIDDYKGAIEVFNKVLQLDSDSVAAFLGRGISYFTLGKYKLAITDFEQVLKLSPELAYGYFFQGVTRLAIEDKSGGVADLQKAADLAKQQGDQELYKNTTEFLSQIGGS